ncbi:MAG: enterotoxin, partial [Proteobacteria bacterium]|nr:enterotoxin [Pseudomonadota bacterium]
MTSPGRVSTASLASVFLMLMPVAAAHAADKTVATIARDSAKLGNTTIAASWSTRDGHLDDFAVSAHAEKTTLKFAAPFAIVLADGKTFTPADLKLAVKPGRRALAADPKASRLGNHFPGQAATASFEDADRRLRIDWSLIQRDDAAYVREAVKITALKQDEAIAEVVLLKAVDVAGATVDGDVNGSPIVFGNWYFGFENPLSESEVRGNIRARTLLKRTLPLRQGQSIEYSAVVGIARPGQLRRDFATYVERERAHPYRPFLHYNSWYDIGYFTPYTQ